MTSNPPGSHVLFGVNEEVGRAFYWLSTGLAVLTALLQGLVTALTNMTDSSSQWTFRFRLALLEHWWWAVVSILLVVSLVMVLLSFASGNGGDAISVLALSSATFLAIVQYTLPAWEHRHYIRTRWLTWTGPSRSAIKKDKQGFCGDGRAWKALIAANADALSKLQPTPSDYYGWTLWPTRANRYNPVDVLTNMNPNTKALIDTEKGERPVGVYRSDDKDSDVVSLVWGPNQGFQRVISRAVSSMPLGLLSSSPKTVDGYDGKGLTNAMGILGRNKGLQPGRLVFDTTDRNVIWHMENVSTWTPRPAKVLRSFYKTTLNAQYSGLGPAYVAAAVELALILSDAPHWAVNKWLTESLEHQSLQKNVLLAEILEKSASTEEENATAMKAHYESSYVSMILSLNYMSLRMKDRQHTYSHGHAVPVGRPDFLCTGILLKARGFAEPSWWTRTEVHQQIRLEIRCLPTELDWRYPMAKLLGLDGWPQGFDDEKAPAW
ncbi:hypothetical protein LTR72_001763 [Exophiala xenobiotica]|nr:hypothetical protein LTR72_001763 [Exophiala xenobiotica]KAK5299375.1 hypothetical protein LTR14_001589 [Exophiala xenobiotica]KAK5499787.1 hypothetical protein LTR55_000610 [Exophiala xenobiotica]